MKLLVLTLLLGLAVAIPLPAPFLLHKRPTAVEYAVDADAELDGVSWGRRNADSEEDVEPDGVSWGRSDAVAELDQEAESIPVIRPAIYGG